MTFMLPIILFSAAMVFAILFYLRQKKNTANAFENINLDIEKEKAPVYIKDLSSNVLHSVMDALSDYSVDALTSAEIPMTVGDHAKNYLKDAAKSVAWAAVGVKAKYRRIETPSFLAIVGDDLHFITTDVDFDADQHLIFDKNRLATASVTLAKNHDDKKTFAGNQFQPKSYDLALDIDGKKTVIRFYDRIKEVGGQYGMTDMMKGSYAEDLVKKQAIGLHFMDTLKEKYEHLTF